GGGNTPAGPVGWIGITFREDGAGGQAIVVEAVDPGAPARDAGIAVGDRILVWNGRSDVAAAVRAAALRPGDTVRVTIDPVDGGSDREVTITAAERPANLARSLPPGAAAAFELRSRTGPGDVRAF